jgi:hypothetical protein
LYEGVIAILMGIIIITFMKYLARHTYKKSWTQRKVNDMQEYTKKKVEVRDRKEQDRTEFAEE